VKRKVIYAALTLLALSAPAVAQGFEPGTLPPHEILSMLRSSGFDPVGRPVRRGPNYLLHAVDRNDREVSLVISARSGDILSVTPLQTASRMPPSGSVTMGPYERVPPGFVPPGSYRAGAPAAGGEEAPPPPGYGVRPPAPIPGALPRSSSAAPLPNRGSTIPDRDDDDLRSTAPNVIPADRGRSAGLPPPPERFPPRAAPQAQPKPKPAVRAAAAPPTQTPLPKPKPDAKLGGNTEASPRPQSPPPATWP